jgi:mono/diheme cytochrome c family protein
MRGDTFVIFACCLLPLAGCEDPKTDMGLQAKYQTYQPAETAQFANGASARLLPEGTVPRLPERVPGVTYESFADEPVDLATRSPVPVDRETLESGQLQFEIFCAACHGRLGNGDGMIVRRGLTRPPSFHVERLRNEPDAHVYNVITRGYGAMLSYHDRVPPRARWEIVAYVRALQAASSGAGVSEEVRAALVARGDRPTTAPTTTRATTRP